MVNLRKRKPVDYKSEVVEKPTDEPRSSTGGSAKRSRRKSDHDLGSGSGSEPGSPSKRGTTPRKGRKSIKLSLERVDTAAPQGGDGAETPPLAKKSKKSSKKSAKRSLKRQQSSVITPRPGITQYKADPLLCPHGGEFLPIPPGVSYVLTAKLALRYAASGNAAELGKVCEDTQNVYSVFVPRSVDVEKGAWSYAMEGKHYDVLELLQREEKQSRQRIDLPQSLLEVKQSGRYDFEMLGHAIRPIGATRGGKEGNNALTKSESLVSPCLEVLAQDLSQLDELLARGLIDQDNLRRIPVIELVRKGLAKMAGTVIEKWKQGQDFNDLHRQVLGWAKQELPKFRAISVKKKGRAARNASPAHFACLNPNTKYIKALAEADPTFNEADLDGWRPVHYAAVCEDIGPLKYLIEDLAFPATRSELTSQKETILHVAALADRPKSVSYLLKRSPDLFDARTRAGYTALHLAALAGHVDVIRALVDFTSKPKWGGQYSVDVLSGPARGKVTAVHLAAQQGHLDVVQLLVEEGSAKPNAKDKLKKSPLLYAVANGQTHVTSYLLALGVNANAMDNSGNSAVHYAAAYAWWFDLKLLIEAGAGLNVENDWKLTPLAVAYLKGHMGICDLLLENLPQEAINCKDEKGMSLLSLTLCFGGGPSDVMYEQVKYLLIRKKIDANLIDGMGNNCLHHLSALKVPPFTEKEVGVKIGADFVKLAQLLIDQGVEFELKNDQGHTPLVTSLLAGNPWLAIFLMNRNGTPDYREEDEVKGKGFLVSVVSTLIENAPQQTLEVFELLCSKYPEQIRKHLETKIEHGLTPFLWLLQGVVLGSKPARARYGRSDVFTSGTEIVSLLELFLKLQPDLLISHRVRSSDHDRECGGGVKDGEENSSVVDTHRTHPGQTVLHLLATAPGNAHRTELQACIRIVKSQLDKLTEEQQAGLFAKQDSNALTPFALAFVAKNDAFVRAFLPYLKFATQDWTLPAKMAKKLHIRSCGVVSLAVSSGIFTAVQAYASILPAEAIAKKDDLGNTAMHYVAMHPHYDGIVGVAGTILAKCPTLVNLPNAGGETPLHLAVNADDATVESSTELVEYLLSHGGNPTAQDGAGRTPLHCAFVKFQPKEPQYLDEEVLFKKDTSQFDPVAMTLMFEKHEPRRFVTKVDSEGLTVLHYAALRGASICLGRLLKVAPLEAYLATSPQAPPPLGVAAKQKHVSAALALIQAGASLTSQCVFKEPKARLKAWSAENRWEWKATQEPFPKDVTTSIFELIVQNEWQGILHVCLDALGSGHQRAGGAANGPTPETGKAGKPTSCDPVLAAALKFGKYTLAHSLIKRFRKYFKGDLPFLAILFENCVSMPSQQVIKLAEHLVESGLDNWKLKDGAWHPVHYAAAAQRLDLVQYLAKLKDLSLGTDDLGFAVKPLPDGHTTISLLLTKCTFSRRDWKEDILPFLKKVVQKYGADKVFNVVAPFPRKLTPTQSKVALVGGNAPKGRNSLANHLVSYASFRVVRDVLKLGADVNFERGQEVKPPLVAAIERNDPHIVAVLLDPAYRKVYPAPELPSQPFSHGLRLFAGGKLPRVRQTSGASRKEAPIVAAADDDSQSIVSDTSETSYVGGVAEPEKTGSESDDSDSETDAESGDDDDGQAEGREDDDDVSVTSEASEDFEFKGVKRAIVPKQMAISSKLNKDWTEKQSGKVYLHFALEAAGEERTFADGHVLKLLINSEFSTPPLTPKVGELIGKFGFMPLFEFIQADSVAVQEYESCRFGFKLFDLSLGDFEPEKLDSYAQEFVEAARSKQPKKEPEPKRPHALTGLEQSGTLLKDSNGKLYDVLMTKVDVQYGTYGYFSFYEMQLIKRKGSKLYIVFTHWGRIGCYPGQYQQTPFQTKEAAAKEFEKIFRSKTKNKWDTFSASGTFVEHEKKYKVRPEPTQEELARTTLQNVDLAIDFRSPVESKLPKPLLELISDLANPDIVNQGLRTVNSNFHHGDGDNAVFQTGISGLTEQMIAESRAKLEEIQDNILTMKELKTKARSNAKALEQLKARFELSARLSNELFEILPLTAYASVQLPVISDLHEVHELQKSLIAISELHVAAKMMLAAVKCRDAVNPYDCIYAAIGKKVQLADPEDPLTQMVLQYVRMGVNKKTASVKGIYQVEGPPLLAAVGGRRKLLFHGTNADNVLPILKEGLRPAPMQSQRRGALFGQGIYLADSFEKSMNYCSTGPGHAGKRYMFLCEASLGRQRLVDDSFDVEELEQETSGGVGAGDFDSVFAMGRMTPDPARDVVLAGGCVIPLGEEVHRAEADLRGSGRTYFSLNHNEYVVFNPDHVLIRFILQF